MKALLDGDIIAYRSAAAAEKFDVSVAIDWSNRLVEDILNATGATEYQVFLSCPKEDNFRYKVDSQYKANRKDVVHPQHLAAAKGFLVTSWQAEMCKDHEADDALGVNQKEDGTVICSIDKDLLQVPGHHYNFVKKLLINVTPDEGLYNFYTQTLVGDRSDNVIGVRGIGPVKAAQILGGLLPEEYYQTCKDLYAGDVDRYHNNCKLLWVWRKPNDVWEPPHEETEEA